MTQLKRTTVTASRDSLATVEAEAGRRGVSLPALLAEAVDAADPDHEACAALLTEAEEDLVGRCWSWVSSTTGARTCREPGVRHLRSAYVP